MCPPATSRLAAAGLPGDAKAAEPEAAEMPEVAATTAGAANITPRRMRARSRSRSEPAAGGEEHQRWEQEPEAPPEALLVPSTSEVSPSGALVHASEPAGPEAAAPAATAATATTATLAAIIDELRQTVENSNVSDATVGSAMRRAFERTRSHSPR